MINLALAVLMIKIKFSKHKINKWLVQLKRFNQVITKLKQSSANCPTGYPSSNCNGPSIRSNCW